MSVISARESSRPTAALPAVRCNWSTRSTVGEDAAALSRAGSAVSSVPSLAYACSAIADSMRSESR